MDTHTRRQSEPRSDKELYQLPKDSINAFIQKERRHDELDRLREVQTQKRVWLYTFSACSAVVFTLVCVSILGLLQ